MKMKDMITPVVRDIPPSGKECFLSCNEMKRFIANIGEPDFVTPGR